jgi:hypothetical protein
LRQPSLDARPQLQSVAAAGGIAAPRVASKGVAGWQNEIIEESQAGGGVRLTGRGVQGHGAAAVKEQGRRIGACWESATGDQRNL